MARERELGEKVAISIATAEAVGTALLAEKPTHPDCWMNVRTLIRNLHGSYKEPSKIIPPEVLEDLVEEMENIAALLSDHVEVTYYVTDNASLHPMFKGAKLRVPRTKKQVAYSEMERMVLEKLRGEELEVLEFNQRILGRNSNATMLTHHPLNLLSKYEFENLTLLESHTGTEKSSREWNTKLTRGKERARLPFNVLTLQVFGDNSNQFHAMSKLHRETLENMAIEHAWTPLTTTAKILSNLNGISDKDLKADLKQLALTKLR